MSDETPDTQQRQPGELTDSQPIPAVTPGPPPGARYAPPLLPRNTPPPLPASESPQEDPEERPRERRRWRGILLSLLLSLSMLYPLLLLLPASRLPSQRAALAVRHGFFQMDNEEGALLWQAQQLAQGRNIYTTLDAAPYVVGTYPPVYLWVNSLLMNKENPSFTHGRVITWMSCLGICALLAVIIVMRTRNLMAAALAALLFLASYEVYQWIAYYRVDFLAIYLSLLGLAFIALSPQIAVSRWLAVLCLVAGLYTKQTTISAPLACFVALTIRDWRIGLRFGGAILLVGGIIFGVLSAVTRGQFAIHTVLYNLNTYDPSLLQVWGRHVWFMRKWLLAAVGIAAIGAALVASLRRDVPGDDSRADWATGFWRGFMADPVTLYALFSSLTFFTIAKAGTAENYLLEPLAGISLLLGVSLGRLTETISYLRRGTAVAAVGAIAAIAAITLHATTIGLRKGWEVEPNIVQFNPFKNVNALDLQAAAEVQALVRAEPRPSWTEYAMFNLQAGRDPYLQPFIMSELSRQGMWNQAKALDNIREQHFGLVVTMVDIMGVEPNDVYTKEMIEALRENYREVQVIRGGFLKYHILRPRRAGDAAQFDPMLANARASF